MTNTIHSFIPPEEIARIFPFEFFHELNKQLDGFTFANVALILAKTGSDKTKKQLSNMENLKKLFNKEQKRSMHKSMTRGKKKNGAVQNIIPLHQLGPMLLLGAAYPNEALEGDTIEEKTMNQSLYDPVKMYVQLYNSQKEALFTPNAEQQQIQQIKPIDFSDPNLVVMLIHSDTDNIMHANNIHALSITQPDWLKKQYEKDERFDTN